MIRKSYEFFGNGHSKLKRMDPQDLDELVEEVLFVSRALFGVTIRSITTVSAEITLLQYRTLVVLASRGPQRMSELRVELGTQPPAVTRLCNRLAERGLIERRPVGGGSREVEVRLTTKGAKLIEDVFEARRQEVTRIASDIPADRRDEVRDALLMLGKATGEPRGLSWADSLLH